MAIGYLLGGLFCLAYMILVGVFGGLKKSPAILKLVKMKLNKNMTDKTAATISLVFGGLIGGLGVFLLVYGSLT